MASELVGVAEASPILGMAKANVAKFLEHPKRNLQPRIVNGQRKWKLADVERAKRDWEAEKAAREAARKARTNGHAKTEPRILLGDTQRRAMAMLSEGPVQSSSEDGQALRMALRRLEERGFAVVKTDADGPVRPRTYELTEAGTTLIIEGG